MSISGFGKRPDYYESPNRNLLEAVASQDGKARVGIIDESNSGPLFDQVDGTWTSAVPKYLHSHYLSKGVLKCSACNWTTVPGPQSQRIKSHVESVVKGYTSHKDVRFTEVGFSGERRFACMGCAATFRSQPGWQDHQKSFSIKEVKRHDGATEIPMSRFVLDAPVTRAHTDEGSVPVDIQEIRSQRSPRPRRRGRRGRGGRR